MRLKKTSKHLFDDIAPRIVGSVIAYDSGLYIVRSVDGDDGEIFYASPVLRPDNAIQLRGCMVRRVDKGMIDEAHRKVLKLVGCFYT